jgi:hypothetical protein
MPWKIFRDGNRHCVHKEDSGGKGELVPGGCHGTRAEAVAHMRALYASEAKEITDATLNLLKEIANDGDENKIERASAVLDEWKARIKVVPEDDEEEDELDEEGKPKKKKEFVQDDFYPITPPLSGYVQAGEPVITTATITYSNGDIQPYVSYTPSEKAVEQREDVSPAERRRAEEEYGDVKFADEANKKYPIDTEAHIRAAWSYINMPKNSAKYSSEKVASIKSKIISAWKKKIDPKGPPSTSRKDFFDRLKEISDMFMNIFKKEEPVNDTGISVWKEGNQYWWMARYSNKFRDNDNPPEIISSESHKRFEKMVKEGQAPLPELWLWHKKEWKVGNAHGIAYDELGFAVALGTFDAGKEYVAEALIKSKEPIKVSHGMPKNTIKYDEIDSTIIVEHETREISPLPAWAAANKLTGFVVLNLESKEESMAIPDETKQEWISKLGIKPETLEGLEAANAADADKAVSEGLESKEAEVTEEAQPATQETVTEPAPEPEVKSEEVFTLTAEQLRIAVTEAVATVVSPIQEQINALEAGIKELKETGDKRDEVLKGTPTASLSALLGQFAQSAIGASETRVDGRTSLAQSKPKETAAQNVGRTKIPFIDDMLAGNNQ